MRNDIQFYYNKIEFYHAQKNITDMSVYINIDKHEVVTINITPKKIFIGEKKYIISNTTEYEGSKIYIVNESSDPLISTKVIINNDRSVITLVIGGTSEYSDIDSLTVIDYVPWKPKGDVRCIKAFSAMGTKMILFSENYLFGGEKPPKITMIINKVLIVPTIYAAERFKGSVVYYVGNGQKIIIEERNEEPVSIISSVGEKFVVTRCYA